MIDFVITIIAAVANILLGGLVILRNPRQLTGRIFFAASLAISGWAVTTYFSDHALTVNSVEVATRLSFSFAFLSIALLSLFTFLFPKPRFGEVRNRLLFSTYSALLVAGSLFSASNFVVGKITIQPGLSNVQTGPFYWEFLAGLLVIFVVAISNLIMNLRDSRLPKTTKSQVKLIILGIGASFIAAVITNGILPVLVGDWISAKLGPFLSVLLVGSVAVAIIQNRLFDIRLVLVRSVTYALVLAFIGLAYGLLTYQVGGFIFHESTQFGGREIYSIALTIVIAFTFQPFRRFFERTTDRIFYRDRYDSQEVLNNFTGILVSELDLDKILKRALTTLCESLHIQFGQIIVFNNDRAYRIEHYGPLPQRLMVAPELRRLNRNMLIADELEGGERKTLLEGHGVRVSLMLSTRDQFVGYLLLGDKLSGDIYSNQDIELLEIIRKELAVAILNAKAYAEIQAFNQSLQARVDHATNRLRVANRHLQELDKAKDEFISMASHQLRTPLTTIKGYLSMMLEGDAGPISPSQKDFVQFAFDASERMVNLISDLLNISRLNAGRFLIQRTPTDMVQMIGEEVHQLQTHADAKGIKLIFDKPDHPLPPAEIDENKTRQVIMNFIDNAIYYTQKGEVKVTLEQTGDMVHLEVHDTGIGVPEAARRKLFTKFYRAANAQTVRPDGTGLGLYLAKRVIQDQDGTIIFNSVEGKGSTFGFELPFKPKPVTHKEAKKQHA